MKRIRGFTLLELLIAASIFSLIILSIYSAFQTGILSYRKVDSAFEVFQTARILLNRMELDLKNASAYTQDDSWFKGGGKSLDFVTVVDYYKEDEPNINIYHIRYELTDEKLKRTCYTGIDAIKKDTEAVGKESSYEIKDITFQYATGKADKPWQDSWPEGDSVQLSGQTKTLPLAVKITLSLIEKGRTEEGNIVEFNKVVSLPSSRE